MKNSAFCLVIALAAGSCLGAARPAEYQKAVRGEKSLISYCTFDSGDASDSVGRHHGKVVGKGARFDAGLVGKAINFTAKTALVEFGYVPEFAFKDGSGTIEVLINHSGYSGGTNYVFAQRSGWAKDSMRYGFSMTKLDTMDVVSRGVRPNFARCRVILTQNQWHHLAVVYSGGGFVQAYLDGNKLPITGRAPLEKGADKHTFHLGAPNAKPDWECWSGKFDELAIYGDALDEKTIVQHAKLAGCARPLAKKPAARAAPKQTVKYDAKPLSDALADLSTAFGDKYPDAKEYAAELKALDALTDAADRLAKFDHLDGIEQKFRKAIDSGRKLYDKDVPPPPAL